MPLPLINVGSSANDGTGDTLRAAFVKANAGLAGAMAGLVKTAIKTANYTTPGGEIVPADTSSSVWTLQLPTTPADGTLAWIANEKAGSGTGWSVNPLTVARGGSDTIDGVAANASLVGGRGVLLQYNTTGTNWRVLLSDAGLVTAGTLLAARASALKTALFTLAAADVRAQDEATGTWTLTVPAASTLGDNFAYTITNIGSGAITLDGPGATNGSVAAGQVATVYTSNGHVYVALGTATTLS